MSVKAPRDNSGDGSPQQVAPCRGLTFRSLLIGLICTTLINLWLHNGELMLGGSRGHTALSNTSIPVGAFDMLFAVVAVNLLLRALVPSLRLDRGEIIVIYAMSAVSTVLSSSGGFHFLLPVITAVHFFASPENQWGELFLQHIPGWMAMSDRLALRGFYYGSPVVHWGPWAAKLALWCGFLTVFALATLCIVVILRRLWVEHERLPFPTVALPLELSRDGVPLFRERLFWMGLGLTLGLQLLNTVHWNIPQVPGLNTRGIDLAPFLTIPPWNAIASTQLSIFGFAVGIGYLLSSEVAFSCWFFFVLTRLAMVWGVTSGWSLGGAGGAQSVFPWIGHQGAGAFLGLTIAMLWLSRSYFRQVWRAAWGRPEDSFRDEAPTYRRAIIGFGVSFALLLGFCVVGGVRWWVGAIYLGLTFALLVAATRTRAETGNAWPTGPDVDAFSLMTTVGGSRVFSPVDLSVLIYARAATAGQDFRGTCMPHQLDALKMAPEGRLGTPAMAFALMVAVALGVIVSSVIAVSVFTQFGAVAKIDAWRGMRGFSAFDSARALLQAPRPPDHAGTGAVGFGMLVVFALMGARTRWVAWPLHPVGYAMANTATMNYAWVSMFAAWLAKVVIVKAGGMRLYRRALPFFLGLIAGDFLGGGLTTLSGIVFGTNAYPANW